MVNILSEHMNTLTYAFLRREIQRDVRGTLGSKFGEDFGGGGAEYFVDAIHLVNLVTTREQRVQTTGSGVGGDGAEWGVRTRASVRNRIRDRSK